MDMANEIPDVGEIMASLTAFPPKLSAAQSVFSFPEEMFESTVKSMGMEVPPGPNKMLVSMMQSFEEMFGGGPGGSSLLTSIPFPLPFVGKTETKKTKEEREVLKSEVTPRATEKEELPPISKSKFEVV
jgi:hypothetical protein